MWAKRKILGDINQTASVQKSLKIQTSGVSSRNLIYRDVTLFKPAAFFTIATKKFAQDRKYIVDRVICAWVIVRPLWLVITINK